MEKYYQNPNIEKVVFVPALCLQKSVGRIYPIKKNLSKEIKIGSLKIYEPHPVCIVRDAADGHWLRARSEMLILKDNQVFLLKGTSEVCDRDRKEYGSTLHYTIPGGGWSESEAKNERYKTAKRETREEARRKVKHVRYGGNYILYFGHPTHSSKKKVPAEYRWYGYYTEIFVGTYDGKDHGFVSPNDLDHAFHHAKFYPISDVINDLRPEHREAIIMYQKYQRERHY